MEAAKAVAQAMAVGWSRARLRSKGISMGPRLCRPTIKQLSFNWSATEKYAELRNFRLEANNISQTCDTNHAEC